MKLTKTRLRQIIQEELNEAHPLGLTFADEAAALGLGKVARPKGRSDTDILSSLGHELSSGDIRDLSPDATLGEVIDLLMQSRAFRDAYEQGGFDERDIEDRF